MTDTREFRGITPIVEQPRPENMVRLAEAFKVRDARQAELLNLLNSAMPAESGLDPVTTWRELQVAQLKVDALLRDEVRRLVKP
jgi:hypothetical protein